jgi:hypothetical protein
MTFIEKWQIAFIIAQGIWLGMLTRLFKDTEEQNKVQMMIEIIVYIIVFLFVDLLMLLPRILHAK